MRRRAGDDLQNATLDELRKGRNEIALPPLLPRIVRGLQPREVKARDRFKLPLASRALDLAPRQLHGALQVARVARLQQLIAQHVAERRRE